MTLEEIIHVLGLTNDDVVFLCTKPHDTDAPCLKIRQIRKRYDTSRIGVKKVYPYHYKGGIDLGWEIVIRNPKKKPTHAELVSLWDVESTLCNNCQRSVIGICPHRNNEPENPEKTKCPTLQKLRLLPRYKGESIQ